MDDEIAPADRAAADDLALSLVRQLLAGDDNAVRDAMTETARAATPPAAQSELTRFITMWAPYADIHVVHTYRLDIEGAPGPKVRIPCGRTPDDPDAIALAVVPAPHQFHVEVAARTNNNDWSTFVWLVPEAGVWKALSFHFDGSGISGKSSRDLGELARKQAADGHRLNAILLYRAATGLADRGPNVVSRWSLDLDREMRQTALPSELQGGPEGTWLISGQTLSGSDVGVMGIGGTLDLVLVRHPDHWSGGVAADLESQAFLKPLLKEHPELSETFNGIIVRAVNPNGSEVFGTVYEFGKGFFEPPSAARPQAKPSRR